MSPWQILLARIAVVVLGLIAIGLIVIMMSFARLETRALAEGQMTPLAPVTVSAGMSFADVTAILAERDLIRSSLPLRAYARWHGLAGRIQAGEYAVQSGQSATELIRAMADGAVIQHALTIIEGWRYTTLWEAIRAHPALTHTLAGDAPPKRVMTAIGRGDLAAEGRFLPETYHFPRGTTDVALLRRANRALEATLASAWANRADNLPLKNPAEALILASIIEKETGLATERAQIAGVFTRRLEKGMRLQTDPTVIYGLGEAFDGDLRRGDLRTDTPYNTYTRHGLPPTPIAMAGEQAITAALNPAAGDSLYFVSRGDGSHVFSATLDAHNAAVRRYQLGERE